MIDKENVLKYFKNKNINVNSEKIDSILQDINEEEIVKSQENRFEYQIWDKKVLLMGLMLKQLLALGAIK